jgi:HNH endonuclease
MVEPFSKAHQLRTHRTRGFRRRASQAEWVILRGEKLAGRPCRVCGRLGARWNRSLHHLVPRSLGGDDVAANLVAVCGSGTTGCHGLIEARDRNAMRQLAENLTDAEYAYCVGKLGEGAMGRLFGV